jgi:NADP-dependent 3-hydroxy acid dehydrogenase YdfG
VNVVDYYANRVSLITGAGSGIGRALSVALSARGGQLALWDTNNDALATTADRCRRSSTKVYAQPVDVTDRIRVLDQATAVLRDLGRVDFLFCAAGVIHTGSLLSSDFEDIEHVLKVNLHGVINTAKAFLPAMVAAGRGHLVTFSSGFGLIAAPHYSAYNASKFAVRGFSESLRQELVLDGHQISVTCVYPGGVRTPIMRNGRFATDEDAEGVVRMFETKVARMEADRAAAIILRGVARRRAQVLVGADAHVASWLARGAGASYQRLLPWLLRRAGRKP